MVWGFLGLKKQKTYILREAMMIYDKHTKTNLSYAVGNFNSFEILLQQGGEFLWHDVASLQELGFSLQPSKGTIEPGQKHTINITWTPNREYKVRNKSFYHSCWCSCESSQGKVVCVCVFACVSALWGGADMCVSFTEGSSDDRLQGHPDGSGLHHCRLTSALPEPWPAGLLFMQAKISIYLSVKLIFFRGITGCFKYC